jgi:hypothetical protein
MTADTPTTIDRLARIETSIERIAVTLETVTRDHETRLRELEREMLQTRGVMKLLGWLGAPSLAAIVVFLATKA